MEQEIVFCTERQPRQHASKVTVRTKEFNVIVAISFKHQKGNLVATTMVLVRPCMKSKSTSYHFVRHIAFSTDSPITNPAPRVTQ